MFEHLKDYRTIVVTGPQRSGTAICAQMIAQDTGKAFLDEHAIMKDSLYLLTSVMGMANIVLQAPAICAHVHYLGHNEDIAVVLVKRDISDIIASQERINWDGEQIEISKYFANGNIPIAQIKYDFWENYQKNNIKHWYEVNYEDLRNHPLWVEERAGFLPHQTRVNEYA